VNAAAYVHDAIGHGVLGLCHVDGNLIGGSRLSLMSFGVGVFSNNLPSLLTAFDLAAIQPVVRSGLLPGSTLFDFTRVGLVENRVARRVSSPRRVRRPFTRP